MGQRDPLTEDRSGPFPEYPSRYKADFLRPNMSIFQKNTAHVPPVIHLPQIVNNATIPLRSNPKFAASAQRQVTPQGEVPYDI